MLVIHFAFAKVEDVGGFNDRDFQNEQFVVEVSNFGNLTPTDLRHVPLGETLVADKLVEIAVFAEEDFDGSIPVALPDIAILTVAEWR